jgi:hypothetical protein
MAWTPVSAVGHDGRIDNRVSLKITAQALPYHQEKITFDLTWEAANDLAGSKPRTLTGCRGFTAEEAVRLALFVLGRGPNPRQDELAHRRIANIVKGILPFLPFPWDNRLEQRFRSNFTVPKALAAAGIGLLIASRIFGLFAMILAAVSLACAALIAARRTRSVAVVYKPDFEPRRPRLLDAWHAVVPVDPNEVEQVRKRLFEVIETSPIPDMKAAVETYGYFGHNGYLERDQLVVRLRQALVYVHVYGFRGELFVGWDACLNLARWGETPPVSSRVEGNHLIQYRSIQPAIHAPNEYDLIDLNLLSELVHRRLKDEIKKTLDEREIREEIDFTIIRGAREAALKSEPDESVGKRVRKMLVARAE